MRSVVKNIIIAEVRSILPKAKNVVLTTGGVIRVQIPPDTDVEEFWREAEANGLKNCKIVKDKGFDWFQCEFQQTALQKFMNKMRNLIEGSAAPEDVAFLLEATRVALAEGSDRPMPELSEILAYVRSLAWAYQTAHWQTRGSTFYGDHLLFERLYTATNDQIDGLAEKVIGMSGDNGSVDPVKQSAALHNHLKRIFGSEGTGVEACMKAMLNVEEEFVGKFMPAMLKKMKSDDRLSDGLENLLQGIMDEHEGFIYLLKQRSKT